MTHYEKLAVIALRVVGIFSFIVGLVSIGVSLVISRPASIAAALVATWSPLFYVLVGVLLFILSKPLASLTVKGLER